MSVLFFGEFRLDPINKRLWRGEQAVDLGGLPFAVLCHLVERSTDGRLVSKRELRERIWGGAHVSDEAIRGCVSTLRKALGDDPAEPRFIKTQNREGFRFLLPVAQSAPPCCRLCQEQAFHAPALSAGLPTHVLDRSPAQTLDLQAVASPRGTLLH